MNFFFLFFISWRFFIHRLVFLFSFYFIHFLFSEHDYTIVKACREYRNILTWDSFSFSLSTLFGYFFFLSCVCITRNIPSGIPDFKSCLNLTERTKTTGRNDFLIVHWVSLRLFFFSSWFSQLHCLFSVHFSRVKNKPVHDFFPPVWQVRPYLSKTPIGINFYLSEKRERVYTAAIDFPSFPFHNNNWLMGAYVQGSDKLW